jgi:hypothetical protein
MTDIILKTFIIKQNSDLNSQIMLPKHKNHPCDDAECLGLAGGWPCKAGPRTAGTRVLHGTQTNHIPTLKS